jgi:acetate kinase
VNILVCNIGSTSLKFQYIDMAVERRIARGHIERIGSDQAAIKIQLPARGPQNSQRPVKCHREAVHLTLEILREVGKSNSFSLSDIDGVGFKCVQAGEKNGSVLLESPVLDAMESYSDLAPAHNPPYLEAIYMFQKLIPKTPLVGVFEPGFHSTVPEHRKIYGAPWDWYEDFGVRGYGYHGASHRYVTAETVRFLGLPRNKHRIISCHLGGSSSLCAFQDGVSVDISMGFSPQGGVLQGRRVGDMDPYVLPYIMRRKGISLEEALGECSSNAGLAGISGTSGDMRDINQEITRGSQRARLAKDKFVYDIKRYIGQFIVLMEGVDAISFTGGIGQSVRTTLNSGGKA